MDKIQHTIDVTDNNRKMFHCAQCDENTPMVHTGTTDDRWHVISIHDAKGFTLYQQSIDAEWDNLTAVCAVCGADIPGELFCEIAYDQPH